MYDLQQTYQSLGGGFTQNGTGPVARSYQEKLTDTVSVKDFGAKGDGVTDDTSAIQAAVNKGIARSVAVNDMTQQQTLSVPGTVNVSGDTSVLNEARVVMWG